jgi:hypothetical protein
MAQEQIEQGQTAEEQESQNGSDDGGHGALKTAAAASVAAGVSYLFAKKALDSRGHSGSESGGSDGGEQDADSGGNGGSSRKSVPIRAAADVLAWDRAQEMLLPMAEKAAGAAGDFVAREAPEVISERLVPRFIEAFNKARKGGD